MACRRWEWWEKHTLNHTHTHTDGRNVDLEIWYVRNGSFMFQQPWSKTQDAVSFMPWQVVCWWASWELVYGKREGAYMQAHWRRWRCDGMAVSEWGEGCQDWGCHHVNGGPSRDLRWWNWRFPDREGDFLLYTSRSWQRSTTFWYPWVWVPHVACQDRTSEMQRRLISKHWCRGSNFPKYWRPR